MVRQEVIRRRLDRMKSHLKVLRQLRDTDRSSFVADPITYGAAERFLQLSIESINDIGAHIVAEMGLGPVDRYRDIASAFADRGWVDEDQRETWLKMIGFRNILVHDYLEIDRHLVYDVLQDHLNDIESLAHAFNRFL